MAGGVDVGAAHSMVWPVSRGWLSPVGGGRVVHSGRAVGHRRPSVGRVGGGAAGIKIWLVLFARARRLTAGLRGSTLHLAQRFKRHVPARTLSRRGEPSRLGGRRFANVFRRLFRTGSGTFAGAGGSTSVATCRRLPTTAASTTRRPARRWPPHPTRPTPWSSWKRAGSRSRGNGRGRRHRISANSGSWRSSSYAGRRGAGAWLRPHGRSAA